MSEAGDDNALDRLTDDERKQLSEFCEVTGSEDLDSAISVLKATQWNLQSALHEFYEPSSPTQSLLEPTPDNEDYVHQSAGPGQPGESQLRRRGPQVLTGTVGNDDSAENQQSSTDSRQVVRAPAFSWAPLVTWPFVLPWRISMGIVQLLLSLLGLRRIADDGVPRDDASERASPSTQQSTGSRGPAAAGDARDFRLHFEDMFGSRHPPFFAGPYMRALEAAHREFKHLLLVLWSAEHDDSETMGRVLTHPDVVAYLSQPQFIVWAGDVARSEAFQVASTLEVTAFPFIALAAQKPQSRLGTAAGGQPQLQVVARIDGLPKLSTVPSAMSVSEYDDLARFVCNLVRDSIAQHEAELLVVRREQGALEAERRLREQQNVAYEASLARDREREAEARVREEAQRIERQREDDRLREEQRASELRKQWQWATFAQLLLVEEREAAAEGSSMCKLNLRLENGRRVVRAFPAGVEMQRLFDFVETRDVASEWESSGVTPYGSDLQSVSPPEGYTHEHDFVLVSQFPRVVFADRQAILKDALVASGMWPAATLIVEPLFEPDDDDDGNVKDGEIQG
ncbi:UBX domain-containing protein 10 [Coemansia sp. S610]|nr:UBX domain-containing protein 10 [Coemansia sp. S610]KAJ2703036.1 UBX domain-containing protein 10 [Coemansia sp. IMI 209128]